ncbi:hypothetical protein [Oceaniglobus indicus]|uniref:hypothetical protein n=1 Tax=Oceaniglobus indicus TaxID=2047749 RepID=UPI0011AB3B01|nr:hypothetical protein [Oceaniglobus indicus]
MDENSNLQDQMARDAEREPGNAQKAWRLLAAQIDETSLPVWVKDYVKRSASVVAEYDMAAGDQAQLAHILGFYKEKDSLPPSGYDYDHIFEWFIERMTKRAEKGERLNISRTANEYVDEVCNMNGNPDSVRKAYEKARARFDVQLKQDIELQQLLAKRKK